MASVQPTPHLIPAETKRCDEESTPVRTVDRAAWRAAVAAVVEENTELLALLAQ